LLFVSRYPLSPWTIYNGTLIISGDANLGSTAGALTFASDGVTPNAPRVLQVTSSFMTDRPVILNAAGTIDTQGNTLTLDGVTSGTAAGSLTKAGTGTLILNGLNTLEVDGSIASSSLTTVSAGILIGTSTVGNTIIAAGGVFAPGSAVLAFVEA